MTNSEDNDLDLDRLVRVYVKIREKKSALATEFNKQEQEFNDRLDVIKNILLDHCESSGVEYVGERVRRSTRETAPPRQHEAVLGRKSRPSTAGIKL